jgi:hypothetical protein
MPATAKKIKRLGCNKQLTYCLEIRKKILNNKIL